jgi:hypothetical protein
VLEDYGYSNYTVEGTNADCYLNLNPKFPVDNWYGEAEAHNFAKECSRYSKGEPVSLDVDHEEGHFLNYVDDPELREMVEKELVWETLST